MNTKGGLSMAEVEKNYSIKEASTVLGVKVRTVREWIKTGKLNAKKYKVSNRWFVPESEIIRLMGE